MSLRQIAGAFLERANVSFRKHPALFPIAGSIVLLLTFAVKDNISDAVRSHLQSVEVAEHFYKLHSDNIELNSRLDKIEESLEDLNRFAPKTSSASATQEADHKALVDYNEAIKQAKLTEANEADAKELVSLIGNSIFYPLWSHVDKEIVQSNVAETTKSLAKLYTDIRAAGAELTNARRMLSVPNHEFSAAEVLQISNAYAEASHDAAAAMFQADTLEELSEEDRVRAIRAADSYRGFLEDENRVCKWAIVSLAILGGVVGLLSKLVGIERP